MNKKRSGRSKYKSPQIPANARHNRVNPIVVDGQLVPPLRQEFFKVCSSRIVEVGVRLKPRRKRKLTHPYTMVQGKRIRKVLPAFNAIQKTRVDNTHVPEGTRYDMGGRIYEMRNKSLRRLAC